MTTDEQIYEEISKDDTYLITNDPLHLDMGHLLFFRKFKHRKSLEELAHEIYTCLYRTSALCTAARKGIHAFDLPRAEALSPACMLKNQASPKARQVLYPIISMIYLLNRVTRGDYLTIMAVSSSVANFLNVTIANAKIPATKSASNPVGMNLTVFSLSYMLDSATRDD